MKFKDIINLPRKEFESELNTLQVESLAMLCLQINGIENVESFFGGNAGMLLKATLKSAINEGDAMCRLYEVLDNEDVFETREELLTRIRIALRPRQK